jgi:hypothetical protein
VTNQTCVHGEVKNRFNSGNASYQFIQNLLSSRWISKNIKVSIYRIIILAIATMGVNLGHPH